MYYIKELCVKLVTYQKFLNIRIFPFISDLLLNNLIVSFGPKYFQAPEEIYANYVALFH